VREYSQQASPEVEAKPKNAIEEQVEEENKSEQLDDENGAR
jgi:hypothetical protein